MWFWRKVSRARWDKDRSADDDEHVSIAAEQISLRSGEAGLSIYHVEHEEAARKVAALYASTTAFDRPGKIDFLLIPPECFDAVGLLPVHVPDDGLHPFLSNRHHEVRDINDETSGRLARAILASSGRRVVRLTPDKLVAIVRSLLANDSTIRTYLRGTWPRHL
jgi:hypothetical protein